MLFRAECWAPGRTRKKNYRASPEPSLLVATALPPRRQRHSIANGLRPPPPPPANLEMVQPLGFGIKIRSPSGAQKALWATRHITVERRKVGKGAPPRSLPARPDVLGERRGSGAPRLMCALSFASLGVLAGVSAPWPLGRPPGLRAAAPLSVLS